MGSVNGLLGCPYNTKNGNPLNYIILLIFTAFIFILEFILCLKMINCRGFFMLIKLNLVPKVMIAVMASMLLVGCVNEPLIPSLPNNQLAISSIQDKSITYQKNSLFALDPKYIKKNSLKPSEVQAIYKRYADAIISDLTLHGYNYSENYDETAFHVGFGLALTSDVSDQTINDKFGLSPGLNNEQGFTKGSFLIYVEDASSGQNVWRGVAQGFVHEDSKASEKSQRAAVVVSKVLQQFYATN